MVSRLVSERSGFQKVLAGLGVAIILVAVAFSFLRFLYPPPASTALTQSFSDLIYVIIQVLFLAVAIWGGAILLDRGLRAS